MGRASFPLVALTTLLVLFAGCGAAPSKTVDVPGPPKATTLRACPAVVDVTDLLARHASAFGSAEAVAALLPRTFSGTLDGRGRFDLVVDSHRYRRTLVLGPVRVAEGIDASGPWELGFSGALVRHTPEEAVDERLHSWLLRREYLAETRWQASCIDMENGRFAASLSLASRPDLGDPVLSFDLSTAALWTAHAKHAEGTPVYFTFDTWTDKEQGVRWPRSFTEQPRTLFPTRTDISSDVAGVSCTDAHGDVHGEACFTPPAPRLRVEWPPSGRVVTVPLEIRMSRPFVRAHVAGREVLAMLDTGATISKLDPSVMPDLDLSNEELGAVDVGDLRLVRLATRSSPSPGAPTARHHLVLGYQVFESVAVRFDYARSELVFAPSASSLVSPLARPVPFFSPLERPVVKVEVAGQPAQLQMDTGAAGGLFLFDRWARQASLIPRTDPPISLNNPVGNGHTLSRLFLNGARVDVGPLHVCDRRTRLIDDYNLGVGRVAGLLGNRIWSACAAVVFDFPRRTLWLEPPCDRIVAGSREEWELYPDGDATWLISAVAADGAAASAGIKVGDRLLEVGGRPATREAVSADMPLSSASMSRLSVTVGRGAETKSVTLELAPICK
jgi:hypothetical protein